MENNSAEYCAQPRPIDDERIDYEQAIKEMREKEKELNERTSMLENMMRLLTNFVPGANSTETCSPAHHAAVPPKIDVQTPPPASFFPATPNTVTNSSFSTAAYSKSYLRDALELVPKYDGHNIPIWQFARACKRAKESVPLVDEALLVRMLKNKLNNHAYLAVEDEVHLTVGNFVDALKRVFGSGRSSNYYRGQLSMVYKKPNEHILDYIGRIKDLKAAIIEGDQTNLGRNLSEVELTSIESFALEAFFEGLPREHRVELRAEGYSNFTEACSKVLVINRRLERDEIRNKSIRTFRENPPPAPNVQILRRDPAAAPSDPSDSSGGRKICTYCKKFGHLIHECRRRLYNENNNHKGANGNSNNNQNNDNLPKKFSHDSGNRVEVSAEGTSRDQWKPRPVHCIEGMPGPSTSSEGTMGHSPPLN